jgi:hypothetical protein
MFTFHKEGSCPPGVVKFYMESKIGLCSHWVCMPKVRRHEGQFPANNGKHFEKQTAPLSTETVVISVGAGIGLGDGVRVSDGVGSGVGAGMGLGYWLGQPGDGSGVWSGVGA